MVYGMALQRLTKALGDFLPASPPASASLLTRLSVTTDDVARKHLKQASAGTSGLQRSPDESAACGSFMDDKLHDKLSPGLDFNVREGAVTLSTADNLRAEPQAVQLAMVLARSASRLRRPNFCD